MKFRIAMLSAGILLAGYVLYLSFGATTTLSLNDIQNSAKNFAIDCVAVGEIGGNTPKCASFYNVEAMKIFKSPSKNAFLALVKKENFDTTYAALSNAVNKWNASPAISPEKKITLIPLTEIYAIQSPQ